MKHVRMPEETRKNTRKILQSQPTVDIDKIFKKKLNKPSRNQSQWDL